MEDFWKNNVGRQGKTKEQRCDFLGRKTRNSASNLRHEKRQFRMLDCMNNQIPDVFLNFLEGQFVEPSVEGW